MIFFALWLSGLDFSDAISWMLLLWECEWSVRVVPCVRIVVSQINSNVYLWSNGLVLGLVNKCILFLFMAKKVWAWPLGVVPVRDKATNSCSYHEKVVNF